MNVTDHDYVSRVYAGVLGKIIGVYLGRPFEGWPYREIMQKLGLINYYVHEKLKVPLVVSDDDISGTFTFVRALEDYPEAGKHITPSQIGQSWLNYIIENRTILWWGGVGLSTEHTAYLRLKRGTAAPASGSMALNGKVVAEQIGAQIFIDGWGMVAPGDPALAADLAERAGSVSHDGEAIYCAQVIAAMEAAAFVEKDIDRLLDIGVSFIPKDSVTARMIADLRAFRSTEPDWRKAFTDVMEARYGYDKYGGNCHTIPNHGVIILALLYCDDDFQKSLMIANTCGWDTDCNSGNVGCLMGIKNGLDGLETGPDWRGPVADRLLLPTADGGACVTDALTQAYHLANLGRALAGEGPLRPKDGAKFHFSLPGSVQGFEVASDPESAGVTEVASLRPRDADGRPTQSNRLAIRYSNLASGRFARAATPTFVTPAQAKTGGYSVFACPTLYAGQKLRTAFSCGPYARSGTWEPPSQRTERLLSSHEDGASGAKPEFVDVTCRLYLRYFDPRDELTRVYGPSVTLKPGTEETLEWTIPATDGQPIAEVGYEITSSERASGHIEVDHLTWSGPPDVTVGSPTATGEMWRRQWVEGVTRLQHWGRTDPATQAFAVVQDEGRGVAIYGTRQWTDYTVTATVTPHLAVACGLAARVQGMRRFYALLLTGDTGGRRVARLVKALDGDRVLAETPFDWQCDSVANYAMKLVVNGERIVASVDGQPMFDVRDADRPLTGGAIGLVLEEGRMCVGPVHVSPNDA